MLSTELLSPSKVHLDYDIVVATRNRADALRVSLPLFLGQNRPPKQLIVIDRSNDHAAVRDLCLSFARPNGIPIEVQYSDKANLPHQRNLGLDRARADVVMFPDDDAFWYPDTAARIMAVYDADPDLRIGGVTGFPARRSPLARTVKVPKKSMHWVRHTSIERVRNRVERRIAPQPFNVYGEDRIAALSPPARAAGLDMPFVPTMGGFRMSFRRHTAQALRFDATLGSQVGYAQHEDKDISLRVLAHGQLLAAAQDAMVFHNLHPGKRANGVPYGFFQIFNYAYICAKVMPIGSQARNGVAHYCRYKAGLYRLRRSTYDREVAHGARAALQALPALMDTPAAELPDHYGALCARHLP